MSTRTLIGLVRDMAIVFDGVGHAAVIVAYSDKNNPVFADETNMFSPLCDQFGLCGPREVYDGCCYPDIRYGETVGEGSVTCLACLAINVDPWFPPETEGSVVSLFEGE